MPIKTAKSHKSQKGDEPAKPRQRKIAGVIAIPAEGSSLVLSPSSEGGATTASVFSDTAEKPIEGAAEKPTEDTGIPVEKPREQQTWYRAADSKLRPKSEKIAVMRAAGHKVHEIAKRLKTTEANIRFMEYIARKNGWYDEEDQPVDVEAELAMNIDRKIVRNISASLDGQMTNWQTHEMTIKGAEGRGFFKKHDKVEGGQAAMTVVAIRVEMPAIGAEDQHVLDEANLGGVPAYSEGEVTDVHELQPRYLGSNAQESDSAIIQREPVDVSRTSGLGQEISEN